MVRISSWAKGKRFTEDHKRAIGEGRRAFISANPGISVFKRGYTPWNKGRYSETRHVNNEGYVILRLRDKPIFEHRLIMERYIGRPLLNIEIIHHKNGIRHDNRIDNLEIVTPGAHNRIHHIGRRLPLEQQIQARGGFKGRHHSIESRKKISLARRRPPRLGGD